MITTEQIINKYPKIFEQYEGNPGYVNWYGVPEGWLPIIDDLCTAIQDYIDHTTSSRSNPAYVEGGDEPRFISYKPSQVTCVQMKEKFGGLRFYTHGGDDLIEGMIKYAEHLCDNTCEGCGCRSNIGRTTGWISTLCQDCAKKQGKTNWKLVANEF